MPGPDIPPCPNPDDPEYVAKWDQYQALLAQNMHKEVELRTMYGPAAKLEETAALDARMDMMLDAILPVSTVERMEFEIAWQTLVRTSLTNLHAHWVERYQRMQEKKEADKSTKKLHLPPGTAL